MEFRFLLKLVYTPFRCTCISVCPSVD